MNAIEVSQLSKTFKLYSSARHLLLEYLTLHRLTRHAEFKALQDISFSVPSGRTLGIIGANGAGKSTLLRILAGGTQPSSGTMRVDGPSTDLIDLGTGFKPDFTGRENVRLNCALLGMNAAQSEVALQEVLEFSELGEFLDYPIRTYSSGMNMRLGFAVAVSVRARVLLVDEVIAVGDNYFQRKCIDKITAMNDEGQTIVMATHNIHAVKTMCQQAMWLNKGRCEALGPAEEVASRYLDYTREKQGESDGKTLAPQGEGQVEILSVRTLDADGAEREEFSTGDRVTVEVAIDVKQRVESPAFGISLHRNDGVYCFGPNTSWDEVLYGEYQGKYRLSISYPAFPLMSGTYLISVGIFDKNHVVPYAFHDRLYSFRILGSRPEYGIVHLDHEWNIDPW